MSGMSTPVNQLPMNKPSTATVPDDPEILNVLQEMEQEVTTAARVNSVPIPSPVPQQMMMPVPTQSFVIKKSGGSSLMDKWVNHEIMQRAAIIGIMSLVMFYPKTMEYIYTIPKLAFLEQFDIFVRAIALAIIVYVASIQFDV